MRRLAAAALFTAALVALWIAYVLSGLSLPFFDAGMRMSKAATRMEDAS